MTKLTTRQREILKNIFKGVEQDVMARSIENNLLSNTEIDEACMKINNEYLLSGIDSEYEATEYGKELESLLDILNHPRLQR